MNREREYELEMRRENGRGLELIRLEMAAITGAFRSIGPTLYGVMELIEQSVRLWATTHYGTWTQGQDEYARWEDDGGAYAREE